jgi:hypothetical protein
LLQTKITTYKNCLSSSSSYSFSHNVNNSLFGQPSVDCLLLLAPTFQIK